MAVLTAAEAEQIAAKLDADVEEKRNHAVAYVRWQGRIIGSYGIRRGSRELGHDYVPRQIFISMRQALDLARCPMSKEQFFEVLRTKGKLPT